MKKNLSKGGFTLIELISSIAVFTIVTGVILYNYSQFNSNVLITNYAYDVALTIRQAQVFGVAVHVRQGSNLNGSAGDFGESYGVHFSSLPPNNSFIFFADLNIPGHTPNIYDADAATPANDESLEIHSLPGSYVFKNFCVVAKGASAYQCSDAAAAAGITPIQFLDISFTRPEPDAHIKTNDPASTSAEIYRQATICLQSPLGKRRQVVVESTGQIWTTTSPLAGSSCDQQ